MFGERSQPGIVLPKFGMRGADVGEIRAGVASVKIAHRGGQQEGISQGEPGTKNEFLLG
jgi:hypothetical protein